MTPNAPITVVAGIIPSDGKVLICQRRRNDVRPLKWEFPGGKVAPGESPRQALRRELKEELGIDARIGEELLAYEYLYPDGLHVHLTFYLITGCHSDPQNRNFADMQWVTPDRLTEFDFLEGNRKLLQHLRFNAQEIPL